MQSERKPTYPECAHLKWRNVQDIHIDPNTLDSVNGNYDLLPLCNSDILQAKYLKKYSMVDSKILQCRWEAFRKRHLSTFHKKLILAVPGSKDQHFCNYLVVSNPELSPYNKKFHGITFRDGPGMDDIGPLPIHADTSRKHTPPPSKKTEKAPKSATLKKRKNYLRK